MRHRKGFNHLGRKTAHRHAMLSNMASSLILHKKINTTVAKAKALRSYIEPLLTRAKDDTTHNRRTVFSYLQNKEAVTELFKEISQKIMDRPGGYTRILKTGHRLGDAADMCLIELVDYNTLYDTDKKEAKDKASRRRRGTGKKKSETDTAAPAKVVKAAVAAEEVVAAKAVAETPAPVVEDVAVAEEVIVAEEVAVVEETVSQVAEVVADDVVTEPAAEESPEATAESTPEEEPKA